MIDGTCDERFGAVREAFEANFASGEDVGASIAATIDGEMVIDLWGGHLDVEHTPNGKQDTIINVWSTTKTMIALCALMLADRGEIDLHAPVARYWPEFAANGKEAIEVRHLLSHTAGLSGWQEPITMDDLYDWDRNVALLAAQAPWWEPGTASGYHAITEGQLVGEVVRRVTGTSLGNFFRTEVAEPLGADFHIGTPAECDSRIAPVIPPSGTLGELDETIRGRTFGSLPLEAAVSFEIPWRRAEIPAANGHGNARSVAVVQSIISNGGTLNGHRFLSSDGVDALFEVQSAGHDLVLGIPVRFGMGYGLNGPEMPISPNPSRVLLGWMGRVPRAQRPRRTDDVLVRDEPDGRGDDR